MKLLILFICLIGLSSTEPFQGVKAPQSYSTSPTESKTTLQYMDEIEVIDGLKADFQTDFQTDIYLQPEGQRNDPLKTGIEMDTVRTIMVSQFLLLLGATVVTLGTLAFSNKGSLNLSQWSDIGIIHPYFDGDMWRLRLVEGVLGAVPIILSENLLSQDANRENVLADFSARNRVMAMFGRRIQNNENDVVDQPPTQPETPMIHTLLFSAAIAMLTGICEEVVFRGLTPASIFYFSHSFALAFFGQAFLFGLRHVSPKVSQAENKVGIALQTTSGLWYGLLYILAGEDILPCIIAHALYDTHILMKTWMHTNDQMDYTDNAVLQQLTTTDKSELRKLKQEAGQGMSVETFAVLRRFFYAFDYERVGTLSKPDVQRAVCYAFINDVEKPDQDIVDEMFTNVLSARVHYDTTPRLRLPEFLRVIISLRANSTDKI